MLEEMTAELLGKEGSLLLPTGNQGNLVAILAHVGRGGSVFVERNSHIYMKQREALEVLAGVSLIPIKGNHGMLDFESILDSSKVNPYPQANIICIENTHKNSGGCVLPMDYLENIRASAESQKMKIHMDGARLLHAALSTNVRACEIGVYTDSLLINLNKGLGAPIGAILAGNKTFISKARRWRKLLGGSIRKAGGIAAAGIVALRKAEQTIRDSHDKAKMLAESLIGIPGLYIDILSVQTNMVKATITDGSWNAYDFQRDLKKKGTAVCTLDNESVLFVTHKDVSLTDIKQAVSTVAQVIKQRREEEVFEVD
jgi:threonine aldolase